MRSFRAHLEEADPTAVAATLAGLRTTAEERLAADGFSPECRSFAFSALARYAGQSSEISVALSGGGMIPEDFAETFGREHERTYGFCAPAGERVELVGFSLLARGLSARPRLPERIEPGPADPERRRECWFPGLSWHATRILGRGALAKELMSGPLIVQEYDATTLVPPGAHAALDEFGNVRIGVVQ